MSHLKETFQVSAMFYTFSYALFRHSTFYEALENWLETNISIPTSSVEIDSHFGENRFSIMLNAFGNAYTVNVLRFRAFYFLLQFRTRSSFETIVDKNSQLF